MRAWLLVLALGCGEQKKQPPPESPPPPGLQPAARAVPRDALPTACSSGECVSACRAGDDAACNGYGRSVREDYDADVRAAAEVAEAGCKAKSAAACELLADLARRLPDGEYNELDYLETSCSLGGHSACWRIANRASDGRDMPEDDARAVELWTRACDGGFHPACATLGLHHANAGRHTEALAAYEKACAGNHEGACHDVALMLADGRGAQPDRDRSLALLEKECTYWGHTSSCEAHREIAVRVYPLEVVRYRSFPIEYAGATFSRSTRTKAQAKKRADEAVRAIADGKRFEDVATRHGDREPSEETALFRHTRDPYGDAAAFALESKLFALARGAAVADEHSTIGYVVYLRTGSR